MKFILGQSETISERVFKSIKWLLSAFSVALTSGFVLLLEGYV
jgi:hypothetical protein